MKSAFEKFDKDKNGKITLIEFSGTMQNLQLLANQKEIRDVFDYLDRDRNGSINYGEFIKALDA